MSRQLVLISIPGLCTEHISDPDLTPNLYHLSNAGSVVEIKPVLPAVTLPVQASLLTGCYPSEHGIVANGFYDPISLQVQFWEQPAGLVQRPRLWTKIKKEQPGFKTSVLFWQNMLYADVDYVITPKPLHLEDKMLPWCYSKPSGLYEELTSHLGPFPLHNYWGPQAGLASSEWIVRAACHLQRQMPADLSLIYIPHLDYNNQRLGPAAPQIREDLKAVDALLGELMETVEKTTGGEILIFSEYSFSNVKGAILPNLLLRDSGLLAVRRIDNRDYLDIEQSKAFAMVDHQVAHIYCHRDVTEEVTQLFENTPEIEKIYQRNELSEIGLDHARSGDLVVVSRQDHWFAYYWWPPELPDKAPHFAHHVDIHRKPGYDPLELFWDPKTKGIPTRTGLIKGSHGHPGQHALAILPNTMAPLSTSPISTAALGQLILAHLIGKMGQ